MNELISPEAVQERQQAGQAQTIVDVRDPDEYVSGRLPGAVNIPYDELPQRLAEIPRDRPVVTYWNMRHRGNSRSERAAALLRESGYQAQALDGGFPGWEARRLPVKRGAKES